MADELRIADESGLTYTCEVRQTDGTLIGSAVSLAEDGSSGRYYGDFPSGSASANTTYDLIYIQDSTIEQAERRRWNGSKLLDVEDLITATGFSTVAAVAAIPTNPLLADDSRLDSYSTFDHSVDEVTTDAASRTASQADVSTLATQASVDTLPDAAAINAEVDTAIADASLATSAAVGAIPTNPLLDDDVRLDNYSTLGTADIDARLEAYDAPTKAELDSAQSAIQANIGNLNDLSTADVETAIGNQEPIDANITQVTTTPVADVDDFKADVSGITVDNAAIADAVWDEATADHTSAGSFGLLISTVATASAVAQAVWEYTSRTLTMTVNAYSALTGASRIRIVRFVTFTNTWSGITVPPTWSKCYFTVKLDPDDESDTAAIVQIVVTNPAAPSTDGLQRINGGAATANQASIVVNEGGGAVAVTISDDATSLLEVADNLSYDIKFVKSGSDSEIPFVDSYCDVVSTATRSI